MAVACGSYITLTATESGEMYSFGSNGIHFGQAWMRRRDTIEPMYDPNFGSEKVAMVAACGGNRAVVTQQGSLWTWGRVDGIGHSIPGRIGSDYFGDTVVMASCGSMSIIVLTSSGRVWTCGKNDRWTPPHPDTFRLVHPNCFNNRKLVMVASGSMHKMAVDEDGMLWTWGDNFHGELCRAQRPLVPGYGSRSPIAIAPAIFHDDKVVHLSGGYQNTMVVTENGSLWACGRGRDGELGIGAGDDEIFVPRRVGGSEMFGGAGVRMTSCGPHHTLIVGTDNRVWACGNGEKHALGNGDTTDCRVPTVLPDTDKFTNGSVMTVAAGKNHSVAVMRDGTVYTWGKGTYSFFDDASRPRPGGTGHRDMPFVFEPTRLMPALFHHARIGHWHESSWVHVHPEHGLAVAMGQHDRLGAHSPLMSSPSELIHRYLQDDMHFMANHSAGLLALLGLHDKSV